MKLIIGMEVRHPERGIGAIAAVQEGLVIVEFDAADPPCAYHTGGGHPNVRHLKIRPPGTDDWYTYDGILELP